MLKFHFKRIIRLIFMEFFIKHLKIDKMIKMFRSIKDCAALDNKYTNYKYYCQQQDIKKRCLWL